MFVCVSWASMNPAPSEVNNLVGVELWIGWVSEVTNDGEMWATATTVGELGVEVDGSAESERSVLVDIEVVNLVIGWSVDDTLDILC